MVDLVEEFNTVFGSNFKTDTIKLQEMMAKSLLEDSSTYGRLPEHIFRDYFLPRFTGHINEGTRNWVAQWVGIAGSPMAKVMIFDPGTGQDLFLVPALMNSSIVDTVRTGTSLGSIFNHYNSLSRNIPAQGSNFLNNQLAGKAREEVLTHDKTEAIRDWYGICLRYGLVTQQETVQVQQDPTSLNDDMFDFD